MSIPYRDDITLLDVMIDVGGLAEGAAGNRAKIIRRYGGQKREINARIHDLINKGRIAENIEAKRPIVRVRAKAASERQSLGFIGSECGSGFGDKELKSVEIRRIERC